MKWLKSLVLASTILVFAWGAQAGPKFYEQATALNRMTWKLDSLLTASLPLDAVLDSIATLLSQPPPVAIETYTVSTGNQDVHWADTLKFSFDVRDFAEVQFKFLADSLPHEDSVHVYFLSSTTGSWVIGNIAYFDRDPVTNGVQGWDMGNGAIYVPVFGRIIAPVDIYGTHAVGPYINIMIVNDSFTHRFKNLSVFAICKR